MSQECPWCHLLSPAGTTRCDCGYNFRSGALPGSKPPVAAPLGPRLLASVIDNIDLVAGTQVVEAWAVRVINDLS
jgi:hypothetical protein